MIARFGGTGSLGTDRPKTIHLGHSRLQDSHKGTVS
jgi:hypothetical protein